MKIARTTSRIEIGKGVAKEIEERLNNLSKRAYIITPWISERFVKTLISLVNKGIDVKVLIYESEDNYFALEKYAKRRFNWKEGVLSALMLIISLAIAGYLVLASYSQKSFFLLVISLLVFVSSLFLLLHLRGSYHIEFPIDIKIERKSGRGFVHTKAYLLDDTLYLSSANLTDNGIKHNIEHLVKVDDMHVVEEFLRYFDSLAVSINHLNIEEFIRTYSVKTKLLKFFS